MNVRNQAFDQAFWQAVDDMHSGTVKPIESYLALVPIRERDQLARMLADVLMARGAAPPVSTAESASYARTLALIDDVLGTATPAGVLPPALKAMRNARGIDRQQVVEQLASDFEIKGAAGLKALERNYHRLETGKLLGTKLKKSLMESLGRIFDIDVRDLLAGGRPSGEAPRLTAASALGRSSGSTSSRRESQADNLLPDPELALVDRLFYGGPDD